MWGAEITGLVGPDGAGKTTLIRLMTGLMMPEEGDVAVLGHDSRKQPAAIQNLIGYMPQRFGLYEDLSVQENLDLYANLRGLASAERPAVFDELLAFTDLKRFAARLAGKLSGGMKQKLGLACALLKKPRLLLLDEPSVGVDPISRRELWKMVQDLKDDGVGVLWSTAYLDEAEALRPGLLLNNGKLLFAGRPSEPTARVEGRVLQDLGVDRIGAPSRSRRLISRGHRRRHPRRGGAPRAPRRRRSVDAARGLGATRRRRGRASRTLSSTCSAADRAGVRSSPRPRARSTAPTSAR